MLRAMMKSAGTMTSRPNRVNHHGAVIQRERNRKRVRAFPVDRHMRMNVHDQSNSAPPFARQLAGR